MDRTQLREMFEAFGERVFRLLHRLTRNRELAEELTQETFVRIHASPAHFRGDGSMEGWVLRIAGNLYRESARSTRARHALLDSAVRNRSLELSASPSGDPERRQQVRELLTRLPEESRTVLVLALVEGYTHTEIAVILGIPVWTSKARLSDARRRAREMLEQGRTQGWKTSASSE